MARARTKKRRPKVAESVKQPVLIAVKVPASPTSNTKPAKKLLDAIGRRPKTTKSKKKLATANRRAAATKRKHR